MTQNDIDMRPDMPRVDPPAPWVFPEPKLTTTSNGLRLLTYDVPGQYVISVRLSIPLPLRLEPRDREGVGTIMARCLDEGTRSHSAEELAELLERTGAGLGAGMAESGLMVDLDVTARNLRPALDLLAECLVEADFPQAEVSRHVQQRLAEIEQERASASSRAAMEFIATYYDPADRAARPSAGSAETVAAVQSQDVHDFFAKVGPQGATAVVAGDLTGIDVHAQVEAALSRWSGSNAPATEPAPAPRLADRSDGNRIVLVDRPGSVQTELYIGAPGPDRRTPAGWSAYQVLGFVLGGSPTSRLDAVLREEKGYTYGIRSTFRPRSNGGLFLTSGSVRADVTVESLALTLDILDGARTGITETECAAGVDFIGRTAPARYSTADDLADEAATLAMDGLDTSFVTSTLASLADLDAEALTAAYRAYAGSGTGTQTGGQTDDHAGDDRDKGSGWTIVLVGDAAAYAEQVTALDRGTVSVVPA